MDATDIKSMKIEFRFRIHLSWALSLIFLAFCDPSFVSGAEKYYYYLHLSSFRLEKRALRDVERLRNKGYDPISKRERVADLGQWYRVYIGPFSSVQEAKLKKEELGSTKLIEYAAIHKRKSLILSDLEEAPKVEEKKVPIEEKKEAPKVSLIPPQQLAPKVSEKPVAVPSTDEEIPQAKGVPVPTPSTEKRKPEKRPQPARIAKPPPPEIIAKPAQKALELPEKRSGRNMGGGEFALGLRHSYRKVELELSERKRITSDGTTTTAEDVSGTIGGEDFSTKLHMDSLHVRFGVNNYLEVFADVGGAYEEASDLGLAYGGGLRLNLFQVEVGRFRGFYGAFQVEYSEGEAEYEYSSSAGNKWKRDIEWEELVAKGELGMVRSWFVPYFGAVFFYYREDTECKRLENLPPSLTSYVFQDDLEEEESFGVYAGVILHVTPALFLNLEGQAISQKSIFGTLEYRF